MKIVQINNFCASGSTGKIVQDIHGYLKKNGHESYVLYGIGGSTNEPDAICVMPELIRKLYGLQSRITGYAYAGAGYATWNIIRHIKRLKPDVVHLHCINGHIVNIYRLLGYLKKNNIPTVITHHAEFLYTAGCGHAMECEKWKTGCHNCESIGGQRPNAWFFDRSRNEWNRLKAAYEGFQQITHCTVSKWVEARAKQSPFFANHKVITVKNGLDTSIFSLKDTSELRAKLNIGNKKVVVHVTPDFSLPVKGGVHVIEMAKRFENEDVVFFVIGAKDPTIKVPSNMRLIAHTANQSELAAFYSLGDVCLLTSEKETFSMVCAESLCCGTPIVGFKAGGPETISLTDYSEFVPQGDDDLLEVALRKMLNRSLNSKQISEKAIATYDKETMAQSYFEEYTALLR